MIVKLILFLIRVKLGVEKKQLFQFRNPKHKKNYYCITDTCVVKFEAVAFDVYRVKESNIRLNYLLSDNVQLKIFRMTCHDLETAAYFID